MEYTWKHESEFTPDTTLKTNRPLEIGKVLVDLCTGQTYRVHTIAKAKENDRAFTTLPAGSCSEEELAKLREQASYTVTEDCKPFLDVVFP